MKIICGNFPSQKTSGNAKNLLVVALSILIYLRFRCKLIKEIVREVEINFKFGKKLNETRFSLDSRISRTFAFGIRDSRFPSLRDIQLIKLSSRHANLMETYNARSHASGVYSAKKNPISFKALFSILIVTNNRRL